MERRPLLQRIASRGAAVMLVQGLGQALMFLVHASLARTAGAATYGVIALVFAVSGTLVIYCRLGLDHWLIRTIPMLAAAKNWGELRAIWRVSNIWVVVMSTIFCCVLLALNGWLTLWAVPIVALTLGLLAVPINALGSLRFAALTGLHRPEVALLGETVLRPAMLLAFVAVSIQLGTQIAPNAALAINLLASVVALLTSQWILSRSWPLRAYSTSGTTARPDVSAALTMLLATGAYQVLTQVDLLVVGATNGAAEAGAYSLASRLAMVVQFGLVSLQFFVAPQLAACFQRRALAEMQVLLNQSACLATAFALAVALVAIPLAPVIVRAFGADFEDAASILQIFVVAHVLNALTGVTGWLLLITGQQRTVATITIAHVSAAVGLMIFVPAFQSPIAIAVITAGTLTAMHITMAVVAHRTTRLRTWAGLGRLLRDGANDER